MLTVCRLTHTGKTVTFYYSLESFPFRSGDDGDGFDVNQAMVRPGGPGLISMVERARHADGRVDIRSSSGEGTTVTARFQLPREGSDAQRVE